MTVYSPAETAAWTADDMQALVGHTVSISIDGCLYDERRLVTAARLASSSYGPDERIGVLEYIEGGSLTWVRDNPGATITVHDEQP